MVVYRTNNINFSGFRLICCNLCFSIACPKDWFTCSSGQCIPNSMKCDGTKNCADGSDESFLNCGTYQLTALQVKLFRIMLS